MRHNIGSALLLYLLLNSPDVLLAQHTSADQPMHEWRLQPEYTGHFTPFAGQIGMPLVDRSATQDSAGFRARGYDAWCATGSTAGLICKAPRIELPIESRGAQLTVRLRMRVPEAPELPGGVLRIAHVTVLEGSYVRIDETVTTRTPKANPRESELSSTLGHDSEYGLVTLGSMRWNGGSIDIRVEYLGGATMILDWISIDVEDASSTGSERAKP
jgi:hypothetical protein